MTKVCNTSDGRKRNVTKSVRFFCKNALSVCVRVCLFVLCAIAQYGVPDEPRQRVNWKIKIKNLFLVYLCANRCVHAFDIICTVHQSLDKFNAQIQTAERDPSTET